MTLGTLLRTFELGMPFVVVYKGEHQYFPGIEALDDNLLFPEALIKEVQLIWYSESLYKALVLEVYDDAE